MWFNGKGKTGTEADGSQDAQGILIEAFFRVADAADDLIADVIQAMEKVDDAGVRMIAQGIDRKVTALAVFFEGTGEFHMVGMTVVLVAGVFPVGCDFNRMMVDDDRDGAMLDPGINGMEVMKDFLDLQRHGICGQIIVMNRQMQQVRADCPAYHIRFIAVFIQLFQEF